MYQFKWQDMVSDQFTESICNAAGANTVTSAQDVQKLLVRLFEFIGGLPLVEDSISNEDREKIAAGLVEDALREAFAKDITPFESTGVIIEDEDIDNTLIESELVLGDFVFVNWCTEDELIALPEIGQVIAKRIIEERLKNGAFKGGKDLSERVSGIGEKSVRKLIRRLRFARRPTLLPSPNTINDLIKMLVTKTGVSPEEGLRRILEYTITLLGGRKTVCWYAYQRYNEDIAYALHDCSVIGILHGSEYYGWIGDAIDKADAKIEMAMFHVAMPTDNHPTKDLVDKLIDAKKRGVEVRVLLDRDREEDPYKSTVINTKALDALKAGGVDARFDLEEKLLHSKFLVLDSEYAVVGSHNWSAGSYFHYDDFSIVIKSQGFAQELQQRFDALWAEMD